ncbi:MAG: hypothetical protein P8Y13_12730 [Deinococcales bacterium]
MHRRPTTSRERPTRAPRGGSHLAGLIALLAALVAVAGCAPTATSAPANAPAAQSSFVGVGIALKPAMADGTGALVIGVLEQGPAARAGVPVTEPPARVIAVDGHDVRQLPIADVVARIRGPEGAPVTLQFALPDGPRAFTLVRERLRTPSDATATP